MSKDEQFMMRAIELAKRGEGLTRPNPPVGAVLVIDNKIIAEGWHKKAGWDHAERDCLRQISDLKLQITDLKSATLYVTLEPCSTYGRTPPCTDLILEHGIGRVVVAVKDLNPDHNGEGLKILENAGVEVVCGVCEKEGRELIAPFEKFITTGMPYVTLKLASTLDGRIADSKSDSKWITGEAARERVQALRRRCDAIMVGAGTVRADNPSLLPLPAEGRNPYRVIVGKNIPPKAKVLTDEDADQTILCEGSLRESLKELVERDIMHVLCEGGGKLAASLIEENLVDEFYFFIAPKLLGSDGLPNFAAAGGLMKDIKNLTFTSVEQIGDDILLKATPKKID